MMRENDGASVAHIVQTAKPITRSEPNNEITAIVTTFSFVSEPSRCRICSMFVLCSIFVKRFFARPCRVRRHDSSKGLKRGAFLCTGARIPHGWQHTGAMADAVVPLPRGSTG